MGKALRMESLTGPWLKSSLDRSSNEPFGSRPDPGAHLNASILLPPHGEVPEGPAGAHLQSTSPCAEAHAEAGAGTGRYCERATRGYLGTSGSILAPRPGFEVIPD